MLKCVLFISCLWLFDSGHYVLDSISATSRLAIPDAKMAKFFSISGFRFFGYITNKRLYIFKWDNRVDAKMFKPYQEIEVMDGVSFDILNTYPRTYLVVIEKALMIFPGRYVSCTRWYLVSIESLKAGFTLMVTCTRVQICNESMRQDI